MVDWKLGAVLLLAATASPRSQDSTVYRHPSLPVSIEAPAGWAADSWRGDPGIFEVAAPDGSITALLWFTDTEQSADRYLAKMVNMKPVDLSGPVRRTEIGGRAAWRVEATGEEQGHERIAESFAVLNAGAGFPGEGVLVLQVWCAGERANELAPLMDLIVGSLRIDSASG